MTRTNALLKRMQETLERRQSNSARRKLTIAAPGSIDFSSNDFLSMSKSAELRAAYLEELSEAIEIPLGSGGSRLLDGNSSYMEKIEKDIADFHNAPSGLLFNSGFDANSGFFACVPQRGDVIIYDEYIHASVHEGMRLSRARLRRHFSHNSWQSFEEVLKLTVSEDKLLQDGTSHVFVAVESVYSMDGDIAPLEKILDLLDSILPLGNGHLMIDEAHSTGVYGARGRGIVCSLGLENRVLARLHTFGKALSSGGAIVLCSPVLRDYLINYARSLIYTTALGLPTLTMINTVHKLMRDGGTEEAQRCLWHLIEYFQARLHELPRSRFLELQHGPPSSPIFSLCTQDPRSLAQYCQEHGFIVRPIVPPTVPEGGERVRVCLHSANTEKELDGLVRVVGDWLEMQATPEEESGSEGIVRERSRL